MERTKMKLSKYPELSDDEAAWLQILARISLKKTMKEHCYRCKRPTYFNDNVGPLKDGVNFHKGCFKCWMCGSRLSLKTYFNNRNNTQDMEVYCAAHVPTPDPHIPIPHRSNLVYSPKTKGEYPHNLMRPSF